ncbi:MAG: hypothetical protein WDA27_11095 [Actinomycetota bacterium]
MPESFVDPQTDLCATIEGAIRVDTYCGDATFSVPAGIATRQIDLVKYADFKFCGLSVPTDGTTERLNDLVGLALDETCKQPAGSGWMWTSGGPMCRSPDLTEAAQANFDLTPQGALPIGTATYTFTLPNPTRDVVLGASFSYRAENALIYVASSVGGNALQGDGPQGSLLVAGDPGVSVPAGVQATGRSGSARIETAFIAPAGTRTGTITFVVIPTSWVSSGVVSKAHVEICNLGLEILTFAKRAWGDYEGAPDVPGTLNISLATKWSTNHDVLANLDPSYCRTRKRWDPQVADFVSLGTECEEITAGIHVPKNNLPADPTKRDAVLSGDPSYFAGLKRLDGASLINPAVDRLYDPGLGVTDYACKPDDPTWGDVCTTETRAGLLLGYEGIRVNGRFFAYLPITDAAIRSAGAAGGATYAYIGEGTSVHALQYAMSGVPPVRTQRYDVGTNYDGDDGLNASSNQVLDGLVSVVAGDELRVTLNPPVGPQHVVATDLACVTVDGTVVCP